MPPHSILLCGKFPGAAQLGPEETLDSIGTAGVSVIQRRKGYRFTLDAPLLAHFAAQEGVRGNVLEFCAGSGVVALLLVRQFGVSCVDALELQPAVHERLVRSVALNGCQGQVRPRLGDLRDIRQWVPSAAYSHVIANPPFRPVGQGVPSPDEERSLSKEELTCSVQAVADAARHALGPGGSVNLVYPTSRMDEVLSCLRGSRLFPRALRLIHAREDAPASRFLVHALRDQSRGLLVRPPLVVHGGGPGGYSSEVASLLSPPLSALRR